MKTPLVPILLLVSIALIRCQSPTATQVEPHQLFTSNAVLQRGIEIPIWGTADPGGMLEIEFNKQVSQVEVDEKGQWQVNLPPMEAGGPYQMIMR